MKNRSKSLIAAFVTLLVANLAGVLLFFRPITEGDTSIVSVHSAVGLFTYVGLCIGLFNWATKQLASAYKGAFIIAAPQFVFIVDLTLRGERGMLTAVAGTILLSATWIAVAYTYSIFDKTYPESRNDT